MEQSTISSREPQTTPPPSTQANGNGMSQFHQEINPAETFQPTSARLRQAAAQALARSHHNRAVNRVLNSLSQPARSSTTNPAIHPQFRSKAVCSLYCLHCSSMLCQRGMRAILLGNTKVELFSTDRPPAGVALVDNDYFTKNCS